MRIQRILTPRPRIRAAVCRLGRRAPCVPRAASVEVYLQVKAPDPKDPKQKGKRARDRGDDHRRPEGAAREVLDLDDEPAARRSRSRPRSCASTPRAPRRSRSRSSSTARRSGSATTTIETDRERDVSAACSRTSRRAIDKLQLGNAGPPGSKGIVVSFSTGAEIKVPMGDLKLITGGALGGQKDYRGKIGTDMVQGITMGLAELSKVSTARKALIVVGDGNDTNNEAAKTALADLKKQAGKQNIQMFAIIYKSAVSSEGAVITTMIPGAKTVNSIDGIASELNAIIARMADRYYLTFPGFDEKTDTGLPWDGKDHDLVIKIDQTDLEPVTMTLTPKWELAEEDRLPVAAHHLAGRGPDPADHHHQGRDPQEGGADAGDDGAGGGRTRGAQADGPDRRP